VTRPAHPEPELTDPVDLCGPDGRLNPAAVGWSRRPLHRSNLRGWGRNKRWEYWGIVSPRHALGLVVSSLDYAGVSSLYLLDRSTDQETVVDVVTPLARGITLGEYAGAGAASAISPGLTIEIDQHLGTTSIRARSEGVRVELESPLPEEHEALGVVIPWSSRRFQYTLKDVARPVSGLLVVGGEEHRIDPADSWAVLDHGRGKWPYAMTWNWAAGSGEGRGIQLGGKWTDGTGMTENALIVEGRIHKIHEELRWEYDRDDWLRPWRIVGERVDARLTPFHERAARTNLGIIFNETHQCFGHFSGWATTDDARRIDLDGLIGWAEEARNRW
jgi:hypothetical protein